MKIIVSDKSNPSDQNCSHGVFVNPYQQIMIKNFGKTKEAKKSNIFDVDELYLSFHSLQGCTLTLSIAFTAEFEKATGEIVHRYKSNADIKEEFAQKVRDKIEELTFCGRDRAFEKYYEEIREKEQALKKQG